MLNHHKTMNLKDNLDSVFMDNMNNDLLMKTGAWPEKYMFADRDGKCIWKNKIEPDRIQALYNALEFAKRNGWTE